MSWSDHLIIAPVVVPLVVGALMLLVDSRGRTLAGTLGLVSVFLQFVIAVWLVAAAGAQDGASVASYRLGDWPAQFGIVLVLDRLSAIMLLLTALLGATSLIYSLARWHGEGPYFHPLFQFLLMGLNGAFLTGDLFNLFVFFEVFLAASYGLALHGSGHARVRSGLHYIAINLTAAFFFLIGVSLVYGAAGTLNMADLARRLPELADRERALFEIGAGILGVAFLVKSAMWPLGFWLPGTYGAAAPPVAAMFSVLTKVGIYVVLRLGSLFATGENGQSAMFGDGWLFVGGIATLLFAMIGMLAAQDMRRLGGYSIIVSAGTMLLVIGVGGVSASVTAGVLFYLVGSALATAAFFLLVELIERGRAPADDVLAVTLEAFGLDDDDEKDEEAEPGVAVPAILAVLGIGFMACALLLAGLPPLGGFIAKFAMLTALFSQTDSGGVPPAVWIVTALLLSSGLATLIAMTRAGIRSFWASIERELPQVRMTELAPIAFLLGLCLAMTVQAGPTLRYMQAAAAALAQPAGYVGSVLAQPLPAPKTEPGP